MKDRAAYVKQHTKTWKDYQDKPDYDTTLGAGFALAVLLFSALLY